MEPEADEILTQGELVSLLAKRLHRSRRTILRRLWAWDVPRLGLPGMAAYHRGDVLAWLEALRQRPMPEAAQEPKRELRERRPRRPLCLVKGLAALEKGWSTGPTPLDTGGGNATIARETCAPTERR